MRLCETESNLARVAHVAALTGCATIVVVLAAIVGGLGQAYIGVPVDVSKARGEFVDLWKMSVLPENVERSAYLAGVAILLPTVIGLCRWPMLRAVSARSNWLWCISVCLVSLIAWLILVFSNQFSYMLTGTSTKATLMPTTSVSLAAFAIFMAAIWSFRSSSTQVHQRNRTTYNTITVVLILSGCLFGSAVRLRSPEALFGDLHFDSVFYTVSQVIAGQTLMADLPAQYGLYAEIISPLIASWQSPTLAFIIACAILQAVASAAFIMFSFLIIKRIDLRILFSFAVFTFIGTTWILRWEGPVAHEYYSLWPIRFLFPALMLLSFAAVSQQNKVRGVASWSVLAGVGLAWNYDWSIPVWGGVVVLFLLRSLFLRRQITQSYLKLLIVVCLPLMVVALAVMYIQVKSGWRINWQDWLKYQTIFYGKGFGMLPMPTYLHPWMVVLLIYIYGLSFGVSALIKQKNSFFSDTLIVLSITGIGVFTYYQGRSHDTVLMLALWPALTILFALADVTLRSIVARKLPAWMRWSVVPVGAFGLFCVLVILAATPRLYYCFATTVPQMFRNEPGLASAEVDFIRKNVSATGSIFISGSGQSILFAELRRKSALSGPGDIELLLLTDLKERLSSLLTRPVDYVFIRSGNDGRLPNDYRSLIGRYRQVALSDNGLLLLVPNL